MELDADVKKALLVLDFSEEGLQLAISAKSVNAELSDMLIDFFRRLDGVYLTTVQQDAYAVLFEHAREWDRDDQPFL